MEDTIFNLKAFRIPEHSYSGGKELCSGSNCLVADSDVPITCNVSTVPHTLNM